MSNKPQFRLLTLAITAFLLFAFSVPIAFICYAAAGGLVGGLAIIGLIALLQLPVYLLLKKLDLMPQRPPKEP